MCQVPVIQRVEQNRDKSHPDSLAFLNFKREGTSDDPLKYYIESRVYARAGFYEAGFEVANQFAAAVPDTALLIGAVENLSGKVRCPGFKLIVESSRLYFGNNRMCGIRGNHSKEETAIAVTRSIASTYSR